MFVCIGLKHFWDNNISVFGRRVFLISVCIIDTHIPSKKNDIDKACSKWNVSNIAEYFSFDDCVTEIKMPTMFPLDLDDIYEMVQKDICRRRSEALLG
jgi:hypothetical protein